MTRRYYCTELPTSGGVVALPETEALHATRVMRLSPGDRVSLFDGCGHEADGEVVTANRKDCTLAAGPRQPVDREPSIELTLAVALPKPDRARELVERLTELGVRRLSPIVCQRTQRPPTGSLIQKLRRGVVEACKQSGRNVLMQVDDPVSVSDFVDTQHHADVYLIGHPGGDPIDSLVNESAGNAIALIGPEGGFTDDEVQRCREAKYQAVGLANRIYRIETAAVAIAARMLD